MKTYKIGFGHFKTRAEGMNFGDVVRYLAGDPHEQWGSGSQSACPVLLYYANHLSDRMGEGPKGDLLREKYLHDFPPLFVGSRSTMDVEFKRILSLANSASRIVAPAALDTLGCCDEAAALRALSPVTDEETAKAAAAVSGSAVAKHRRNTKAHKVLTTARKCCEITASAVRDAHLYRYVFPTSGRRFCYAQLYSNGDPTRYKKHWDVPFISFYAADVAAVTGAWKEASDALAQTLT